MGTLTEAAPIFIDDIAPFTPPKTFIPQLHMALGRQEFNLRHIALVDMPTDEVREHIGTFRAMLNGAHAMGLYEQRALLPEPILFDWGAKSFPYGGIVFPNTLYSDVERKDCVLALKYEDSRLTWAWWWLDDHATCLVAVWEPAI